jgi:Ras-related GTP-binding protein A/B
VNDLTKSLNTLAKSCGAVETVIFEKNTFLLVARSSEEEDLENTLLVTHNLPEVEAATEEVEDAPPKTHLGQANRFEILSGLIKGFRNGTNRFSNEPFEALRMEWADFTLVLDILTSTSYVLVIGSNKEPRISEYHDSILSNADMCV